MEWSNVRQLTWCNVLDENGNGTVHTFAYGADGIRCRKNNIHYTCDGERILIEHNADTGRSITYLYGEKGVVGFSYRGSDYYYRKNLFGDVVAIYNTSGTKVATYKYDAWGKNLSCEDEETNEIKHVNPFRYRSYYYDVETGFYYLNSRYYDPEIGRFLNADSSDYLGEGNTLNNYNLFAYCGNNPIMYSDPQGHSLIASFFIGLAVVYAGDIINNLIDGKTGIDVLARRSSLGVYLAGGITAIIPGKGLGAALIRNIVAEGIKTIENVIKGAETNFATSIANIGLGTFFDISFEKILSPVTNFFNSKTPKNYSSYANKARQSNPNLTQEQIYNSMRRSIRFYRVLSKISEFGFDLSRGFLPY